MLYHSAKTNCHQSLILLWKFSTPFSQCTSSVILAYLKMLKQPKSLSKGPCPLNHTEKERKQTNKQTDRHKNMQMRHTHTLFASYFTSDGLFKVPGKLSQRLHCEEIMSLRIFLDVVCCSSAFIFGCWLELAEIGSRLRKRDDDFLPNIDCSAIICKDSASPV